MLDDIRNKAQSWGIKIIFGIIIVVFVFWGVGNMGSGPDGALATVNGETISLTEYRKALEANVASQMQNNPDLLSDKAQFDEFKRQLLNEMMYSLARKQEAARLGIMVTPNELKKELYGLPYFQDSSGKFSEAEFQRLLDPAQQDQLLRDLEQDLLNNKLMSYVGMSSGLSDEEARLYHAFGLELRYAEYVLFSPDQFKDRAEVSEDEIAAYYEANKDRYARPLRANIEYLRLTPETLAKAYPVSAEEAESYYQEHLEVYREPEMFQARLIAISAPPQGSTQPEADELIARAQARADEVVARLRAGEDFGELAKEYSEDQESARVGGLLPWLETGETGHDDLNQAIRTLEPGQTSDVIRTSMGFHLLKIEDRKPSVIPPFAELRERITSELARKRADEDMAAIQGEAQDALHLGGSLADFGSSYSLELEKSGLIPEQELRQKLSLDKEYTSVFADAVAEAAASGEPANIPVPLQIKDGFALVRIIDAVPAQVPALDDIRVEVRDHLRLDKARTLAAQAANEALASFTGPDVPEAFSDKLVKSQGVTRGSESVEPLGPAPDLVAQLFYSKGGWLPQVFTTPGGPVIARLASVEKPTAERWELDKGMGFVNGYKQWQTNNIVTAFLMSLYERSKFQPNYKSLDLIGAQR